MTAPETDERSEAYWARPKKEPLTEEAGAIVREWGAFQDFERSFDVMTRAGNEEELKLAVKDLLEKEATLAKTNYPGEFDEISVKSRQRVLQTYLLKLQWQLENRDSVANTVADVSNAYNAMRTQFNTVLRSREIDTLKFLDR